jgi:glycosyltransferase involved in cell wall biosynthesis
MILFISCVFPPEPVVSASISHDLAHNLSVSGEVMVVCPRPSRPYGTSFYDTVQEENRFKMINVKSFVYPGNSFLGRMLESISFGRATRKVIREQHSEISVVYANTWPLFAQYAVTKTCKELNIPLVLHVQDIYPETLTDRLGLIGPLVKALLMPLEKYVMNNVTAIVAIGNKMAEYLTSSRGFDKNKITVVYNWQDESRFKEPEYFPKPGPGFTFMYLGSLSPSANIEAVIEAFGDAGLKDSTLVIAGSGNSKQSCINASSVYPNANIRFVDAPSDKVPDLLATADVLILPLKKGAGKYSTPSKLAGYMLSSRPVLAFIDTESDAADIIRNAECGWIVPSGNIQALTLKMQEIRSLPETSLAVPGQSGRAYALKHLSKAVNLAKLADLIMSYSKR